MDTIGSKRSYTMTWCMPNNDDDDDDDVLKVHNWLKTAVNNEICADCDCDRNVIMNTGCLMSGCWRVVTGCVCLICHSVLASTQRVLQCGENSILTCR